MRSHPTTRTISLTKGGQKFVIRYGPGSEYDVVDEIMRMAEDGTNDLDWLDAATLSFQVTHSTAGECSESLCPPPPNE